MNIIFGKRINAYIAMLCVAVFMSAPAFAQDKEPIKIGAIYIMSGSASAYGKFADQGLQLAIDKINSEGGILDRQVEYQIEDGQGEASVAIQNARKLVYQEGVDALVGLDSSGVALSLVPIVPDLGVPLIITHAATPDATGAKCNSMTFRVRDNVAQHMNAAARVASQSDAKKWTTIGPDYAFGHQTWEYFSQYLSDLAADVEIMEFTSFPDFGAEAYTSYINAVMDADPDGVMISLWGGDLVNFIRQATDLGFFEQDYELLFAVGGATEVLTALGDQMPEGVWLGTRYWFDAYDNPVNKVFVSSYMDEYGRPSSYHAEGAYAAMLVYKEAVEKAGTSDAEAVAEALSGLTFNAPNGEVTIRSGDHQALVSPNWGKSSAMDDDLGIRTLDPL